MYKTKMTVDQQRPTPRNIARLSDIARRHHAAGNWRKSAVYLRDALAMTQEYQAVVTHHYAQDLKRVHSIMEELRGVSEQVVQSKREHDAATSD